MKLQLAMAGIGLALVAVSMHANGGDLPTAVEVKASVTRSAMPAASSVRGLETLSPGNRLIAQALYSAQKSGTLMGGQPWSLDRIAVARADGRNWGEVFQQMKQDGLLEAETLGQVVTWYQYHHVTPVRATQDMTGPIATAPIARTKPVPLVPRQ